VSSPSYSFVVDDLVAEKGDEASSSQALSEENRTKLKGIPSLLQRDIQDQVRDADLLREALELIDQDLPTDIKVSLEPVSQLLCSSKTGSEESILPSSSGTKESYSQAIRERLACSNSEQQRIAS
jgi:hypothetical protein